MRDEKRPVGIEGREGVEGERRKLGEQDGRGEAREKIPKWPKGGTPEPAVVWRPKISSKYAKSS